MARRKKSDDRHFGQPIVTPAGRNRNPHGEKQIGIPKARKFAETDKEWVELIMEVLANYLRLKGFDSKKIRLLIEIARMFITKDNWADYINLPAVALYKVLEDYILNRI